jgi:hypothetical protein
MVQEGFKQCKDCNVEKPLGQFHKHSKMADGRHNYCIECFRRRNRERYYRRLEGDHRDRRRTRPLTPQGHRLRPDCGERKPATEFAARKRAADGLHTYCKACNTARATASAERIYGSVRGYHLQRRYGLGAEEVAEMIENQGRVCAICLRKPAAHVDHEHGSGAVRGILCFTCNVGLGNFGDDPELMARGIDYLKGAVCPIQRVAPGVYRLCS